MAAFVAATVTLLGGGTLAAEGPEPQGPAPVEPDTRAPRVGVAATLPHLRIDRKRRIVDVDAKVVFEDHSPGAASNPQDANPQAAAGWIELVACAQGMREYESLVAVLARPSHIHQALLMIGLAPGSPMRTRIVDDKYQIVAPHGPRVAVSVVLQQDSRTVEVPINRWVVQQRTNEMLADNVWLFTGSTFARIDDSDAYMADLNGSVVSLVNFGDDLMARPTLVTNQNDQKVWGANAKVLPPVGTPVVIRLRAVGTKACCKRGDTRADVWTDAGEEGVKRDVGDE